MTHWHLSRARTRVKTARDAIGGIAMSDDMGALAIELLQILDAMLVILDKRMPDKARRPGDEALDHL
jgi:hypothetical protein